MFCGHIFSAQCLNCNTIGVLPFKLKAVISCYLLYMDSNFKNATAVQMLTVTHTTVAQVTEQERAVTPLFKIKPFGCKNVHQPDGVQFVYHNVCTSSFIAL